MSLFEDLRNLSASERILLAQDLWDSVTDDPSAWELTSAQQQLLERRLAAHRRDPNATTDWATARERTQRRS